VLCPLTFANVAPPVVIVALLAVGQAGSVDAVPATVHLNAHCAFKAGAVGFTMLPTLYTALGTNAAIAAYAALLTYQSAT
jgi:hypothetical protein